MGSQITIVCDRLNQSLDIENTLIDLLNIFPKEDLQDVLIALKNGSIGLYGRTYKLNIQEICIWIREYKKEKLKRLSEEQNGKLSGFSGIM